MTDTIDLLLDAVQVAYDEETPNEALRPPFIEHVEEARADERKKVLSEVLDKVEEILPYGAGFTGRFYTLKDELLNQLKGTDG